MDEAGFMRAIVADPDSDAPRLIYADWLDEHWRPERAEFIRVQCELAGMAEDTPGRKAFENRAAGLLRLYERTWAPSNDLYTLLTWRRGFVWGATPSAEFVARGSDSFKILEEFPTLEELSLHLPFDDQAFSQVPDLPILSSLVINVCEHLSAASMRHVTRRQTLRHLQLYNYVDGEFVRQLAGLDNLEVFELSQTDVGDGDLPALASFPTLRSLSLSGTMVSPAGLPALGRLPLLRTLRLGISSGVEGAIDAGYLSALESLPALRVLILDGPVELSQAEAAVLRHRHGLESLVIDGVERGIM